MFFPRSFPTWAASTAAQDGERERKTPPGIGEEKRISSAETFRCMLITQVGQRLFILILQHNGSPP